MTPKTTLAKNIRYFRKKKGLSQEDISDMFGYQSYTTIQKWEAGSNEPNINKVLRLAKLFGVTVEELITTDFSAYE